MIREANLNDVSKLLEMSKLFLSEAKVDKFIPLNEYDLMLWVRTLINNTDSVIIVYEEQGEIQGSIAGSIASHYTNSKCRIATEFAWWVYPEARGKVGQPLLNAFEVWAKASNADVIVMASLEELSPKLMDRVYTSLGYKVLDHSYIKGF